MYTALAVSYLMVLHASDDLLGNKTRLIEDRLHRQSLSQMHKVNKIIKPLSNRSMSSKVLAITLAFVVLQPST